MLHPYRLTTSGSGVYLVRVMKELLERRRAMTLLSHDPEPELALPPAGQAEPAVWRSVSLRAAGTPTAYPRAEEPGSTLFRNMTDSGLQHYLDYHVDRVSAAAGNFDVLHVNGEVPMSWVGSRVQERTGVPYVTVAHGSTLEYVARTDSRFASLARTGLTQASAVVALNAEVRHRVLSVAPEARVVTIPVGVDTDVFTPAGQASASRPPTLIYVGRLSIDKGLLHLLGAMPRLAELVPGVRLIVVGDGLPTDVLRHVVRELRAGRADAAVRLVWSHADVSEQHWAHELVEFLARHPPAAERDFRVCFRGRLDEHGVAAALREADAAVVPSLVHEAFPLIVLEALAAGVPPLVTDAGGLSAVLDEIEPHLSTVGPLLRLPGPGDGFAEQLPLRAAELLTHLRRPASVPVSPLCRQLAVERYSWRVVVDGLEGVYERVRREARTA
jgi:glycosyltransferase involved in cell wall biosynthesis